MSVDELTIGEIIQQAQAENWVVEISSGKNYYLVMIISDFIIETYTLLQDPIINQKNNVYNYRRTLRHPEIQPE